MKEQYFMCGLRQVEYLLLLFLKGCVPWSIDLSIDNFTKIIFSNISKLPRAVLVYIYNIPTQPKYVYCGFKPNCLKYDFLH